MKAQNEETSCLVEDAPGAYESEFHKYWGHPYIPNYFFPQPQIGQCLFKDSLVSASSQFHSNSGKRIPEISPLSRWTPSSPYPVHDWIGDQFSTSSTARAEKSHLDDRKEPRRQRRSARSADRPLCPVIHVRRYTRPSWLTSSGVNLKRKIIERKGLPSFKNWRFITLTFSRERFPCPLEAYLAGSDHMRRFFEACRKANIWKRSAKWAWKLEFQADGYPHWHVLVDHRTKLTFKQLRKIGQLWGLGRANTERIEQSRFGYSFKYAFKPVSLSSDDPSSDNFERLAPDWFLDYISKKTVKVKNLDGTKTKASKTVTFSRVRFWQTSKGFYDQPKKLVRTPTVQKTWIYPITVREALDLISRTVQVVARRSSGQYESSIVMALDKDTEKFWALVGFDCMHNASIGLGVYSYMVPINRLTTNKLTKWLLQPILKQNRLTLYQAEKLRKEGQTLLKC